MHPFHGLDESPIRLYNHPLMFLSSSGFGERIVTVLSDFPPGVIFGRQAITPGTTTVHTPVNIQ